MKKECIIYPCYFDSHSTREQGRRVPLFIAKPDPSMKDVIIALKKNRLSYQIEGKSHPSYWWKGDGRVVVTHTGSKQELLLRVAKDIVVKDDPTKFHRARLKRAKKGETKETVHPKKGAKR